MGWPPPTRVACWEHAWAPSAVPGTFRKQIGRVAQQQKHRSLQQGASKGGRPIGAGGAVPAGRRRGVNVGFSGTSATLLVHHCLWGQLSVLLNHSAWGWPMLELVVWTSRCSAPGCRRDECGRPCQAACCRWTYSQEQSWQERDQQVQNVAHPRSTTCCWTSNAVGARWTAARRGRRSQRQLAGWPASMGWPDALICIGTDNRRQRRPSRCACILGRPFDARATRASRFRRFATAWGFFPHFAAYTDAPETTWRAAEGRPQRAAQSLHFALCAAPNRPCDSSEHVSAICGARRSLSLCITWYPFCGGRNCAPAATAPPEHRTLPPDVFPTSGARRFKPRRQRPRRRRPCLRPSARRPRLPDEC